MIERWCSVQYNLQLNDAIDFEGALLYIYKKGL